jgi:hypothetical protein
MVFQDEIMYHILNLIEDYIRRNILFSSNSGKNVNVSKIILLCLFKFNF